MQPNIDEKILSHLEGMISNFHKKIDEIFMQRHREIAFK